MRKSKSVARQFSAFLALTLVSAIASAVFAQAPAGSPVATHGQLKVVGSQVLDEHDEPVQLRGMSLYWSMGPAGMNFYNDKVVKWLRDDWNANLVRAAMGVEANWGTTQRGYVVGDNSGGVSNKKRVTDVVDGAIANGMYVIIDWHSHKADTYQSQAISFFEEMATAYGNHPNVIYEIFNEPEGQVWGTTIKPYAQAVVNAIRAIDPHNLIIIGTPSWCQRPDLAAADPVEGENLLYAVHFYSASHKATNRNRVTTALASGKAVFASEFGTGTADGNGTHDGVETDTWLDFLDERNISWANWSLSTTAEATAALTAGATATPNADLPSGETDANWGNNLSTSGTYIRNRLRGYESSTAARGLLAPAARKTARWTVRQTSSGIYLRAPESGLAEISFYDMRGKQAGKFLRSAGPGGETVLINSFKVPAGNYLMTVKDRASNRVVYKTKIPFVK